MCVLHSICIEETDGGATAAEPRIIRKLDDETMKKLDIPTIHPRQSVSSACLKNLENITLVPNPTTGELRIINYESGIMDVEIFDVYGRMQKVENRKQNVYDISHLQSGIYFVRIITEGGEIVKKVVKQ